MTLTVGLLSTKAFSKYLQDKIYDKHFHLYATTESISILLCFCSMKVYMLQVWQWATGAQLWIFCSGFACRVEGQGEIQEPPAPGE